MVWSNASTICWWLLQFFIQSKTKRFVINCSDADINFFLFKGFSKTFNVILAVVQVFWVRRPSYTGNITEKKQHFKVPSWTKKSIYLTLSGSATNTTWKSCSKYQHEIFFKILRLTRANLEKKFPQYTKKTKQISWITDRAVNKLA